MACNDAVVPIHQYWVSPAKLFYAAGYLCYLLIAVGAAVVDVGNKALNLFLSDFHLPNALNNFFCPSSFSAASKSGSATPIAVAVATSLRNGSNAAKRDLKFSGCIET